MSNKIYVGDKPRPSYISAILKNLSSEGGDNERCHLISRSSSKNGKALDVAEMVRRDNEAITIEDISIETQEFFNDDELDGRDPDALDDDIRESLVRKVTKLDVEIKRN